MTPFFRRTKVLFMNKPDRSNERTDDAKRGLESVWDYPRPPRLEPTSRRIRVVLNGVVIAETSRALRVLETSHPPVYYIPREDVAMEFLEKTSRSSVCEWKGLAEYYTARVNGKTAENITWSYPSPKFPYSAIAGHLAFYATDQVVIEKI